MLVISRRPGECLVIGDDVEIEVLDSSPSQVKLGIRAPKSIMVVRKEIQLTRAQNQEAARAVTSPAVLQLLDSLQAQRVPHAPPKK